MTFSCYHHEVVFPTFYRIRKKKYLCIVKKCITLSAPGSYEELKALLHGHSADEQVVIISRLRKCHHPSLAEGNKDKLEVVKLDN